MLSSSVLEAVHLLKQGQVLAYPTEAVWGLGCDPFNQAAFAKILNLKQRPIEKGVILLASSIAQVQHLIAPLDGATQQRIIASWENRKADDQGVTWLLPTHSSIPNWISGQHASVAVRVTQHPLCQQLCEGLGSFIVSTSANPAGLTPARNLEQAQHYFGPQVAYLAGELGQSPLPSKIIDALSGKVIRD
ncbi:L-threonylcarbamoyladenylate synthase [Acinetobacter sp. MD2(2019)]|uniref:L-threonylcarbamoyladenylate synthase n=1 Tax=Acinetobacter sp. MD2(2019) TaxID=2605273 RepID=UPI002D1F400A|nr:Sua5/YciO/YrdC/YwlC family protein [Acinetobacter sp. MD2(2019)]MEB3754927.1 Sua5/YciO/YrdC/YwlC family protein [Acinetobacter sp. MD2(2019)]